MSLGNASTRAEFNAKVSDNSAPTKTRGAACSPTAIESDEADDGQPLDGRLT
jgi:hypothetical protein